MNLTDIWIDGPAAEPHDIEIDRRTLIAFWRLGRALATNAPCDREVFNLGRCIGQTPGTTATLYAMGASEDPSAFAMSKLVYGGHQPMHDAYWQSPDQPAVFVLARKVYDAQPDLNADETGSTALYGGALVFDVSQGRARLAGLRVPA